MKAPRKLFRKELLIQMSQEAHLGVPISAIKRKYELECSNTHLSKHIGYYQMFKDNSTVIDSIFPGWLNAEEDLQEESKLWKYVGLFPWGHWMTLEEWLQR